MRPRFPTLRSRSPLLLAAAALLAAPPLHAQGSSLSPTERRMRDWIERHRADQVHFLGRVVDINSGTLDVAGVREVGAVFRAALDSLGFRTRWVEMPPSMHRAGHLIAEHRGRAGGARIVLIGHLDTVFEGEGQQFVLEDTVAKGAGSSDMKGGDAIILYALKAMRDAGTLKDANIVVVLHGDEEAEGDPMSISRRDLIDIARRSDIALAFEGGSRSVATVARRGDSQWLLTVHGRQAHSAGIFGDSTGYGAVFEAARILDEFRRALARQPYLTFNPGLIVGGTTVRSDTARVRGSAAGKLNIVANTVVVQGDLRFLTDAQKDSARARMREIVARSLPRTRAEIVFGDEYPGMPPTPGNMALLAAYDSASRALGYGPVRALDPGKRGAGDISFIARYVDALDGLGADGRGAHSPREEVFLRSLPMQTERAAVLISRLAAGRGGAGRRAVSVTP